MIRKTRLERAMTVVWPKNLFRSEIEAQYTYAALCGLAVMTDTEEGWRDIKDITNLVGYVLANYNFEDQKWICKCT